MKPVVATVVVVALGACNREPTAEELAKLTVVDHRVTAASQPGPFARADAPELRYEVAIRDVPKGSELALTCDWLDPSGARVHQNHWTTKAMDHDPWPTHCRYALTPTSATGTWTVTMKQGDRVLATDLVDVR